MELSRCHSSKTNRSNNSLESQLIPGLWTRFKNVLEIFIMPENKKSSGAIGTHQWGKELSTKMRSHQIEASYLSKNVIDSQW